MCVCVCVCVCSHTHIQLCLTLCGPLDCSLAGSSVRGILQASIVEWFAISFSRGSSWPRDQTCVSCVSCICRWVLYQLSHQERYHFSDITNIILWIIYSWYLYINIYISNILCKYITNICYYYYLLTINIANIYIFSIIYTTNII